MGNSTSIPSKQVGPRTDLSKKLASLKEGQYFDYKNKSPHHISKIIGNLVKMNSTLKGKSFSVRKVSGSDFVWRIWRRITESLEIESCLFEKDKLIVSFVYINGKCIVSIDNYKSWVFDQFFPDDMSQQEKEETFNDLKDDYIKDYIDFLIANNEIKKLIIKSEVRKV